MYQLQALSGQAQRSPENVDQAMSERIQQLAKQVQALVQRSPDTLTTDLAANRDQLRQLQDQLQDVQTELQALKTLTDALKQESLTSTPDRSNQPTGIATPSIAPSPTSSLPRP